MSKLAELAAALEPGESSPGLPASVETKKDKKESEKISEKVLTKTDKFAILAELNKTLNKQFNVDLSLARLGHKANIKIPCISTNLPSLDDYVLECGGIPRGRIIEIFGPESCLEENTFIQYTTWDNVTGERSNHKGGTIKHLYERFHNIFNKGCGHHLAKTDITFTAPSINEEDRVFHNKIEDVVFAGPKPCIKITLNDGSMIETTKEHKFFSNGKFIEAGSLEIGNTVYIHNNTPFTCKYPNRIHRKEFLVKSHKEAHKKIIDGKYVYYRLTKTRAVVEASINNMTLEKYIQELNLYNENLKFLPSSLHIHHIDEDVANDSLNNLVIITPTNHGKIHAYERHNNLRFVAVERTVTSIEDVGVKNTYDIKMKSPFNNYVANTFIVHNSGKTTLALHIVACEQNNTENLCAIVDAEHALDVGYAKKLGVNTDELLISQPDSGEQALETVDALVDSGTVSLIVIDSVAALVPQAELDGEMGDSNMGLQARLMSQAMRKLRGKAHLKGVTLIFINQIREKIGVMFGSPETTTGGRALKFFTTVRLDVRRKDVIGEKDKPIGHTMKIKAVKNKSGSPMREAFVDLLYGVGFDTGADLIKNAVEAGVVEKSGAWYSFQQERLGNGLTNSSEAVRVNPELFEKILNEYRKAKNV